MEIIDTRTEETKSGGRVTTLAELVNLAALAAFLTGSVAAILQAI
ncbi:MAG: hypothetical protein U5O39_19185 [Gammaproteobacteria bacterium]|nr:hypothetical protein [Gammaproteobacteria bacterium]